MNISPESIFPLRTPLPLPEGVSEDALFDFVTSIVVEGAPPTEMISYATHDFRRFVYTYGLCPKNGKCLELGANPYFTTMILRTYTNLELTLANYFGQFPNSQSAQNIEYRNRKDKSRKKLELKFDHFNIEDSPFPYTTSSFDVVVFGEIIEHLLNDPLKVLREIKRVLKPDGILVLTTPNVARLENIARLIAGANIYDPYSGYGPYGRHNREFNRHELALLLDYAGFGIQEMFTADVHANHSFTFARADLLSPLVEFRKHDLGQYIFVKAINSGVDRGKKPSFLYRSCAPGEIEMYGD